MRAVIRYLASTTPAEEGGELRGSFLAGVAMREMAGWARHDGRSAGGYCLYGLGLDVVGMGEESVMVEKSDWGGGGIYKGRPEGAVRDRKSRADTGMSRCHAQSLRVIAGESWPPGCVIS